ncbi:TetR family transcriptional regulator [Sphaerisporangium melleum]|uniref:TetR family transcriptional regulator n=2 Tax=Sphaerisporangium melleum TaxID=321316 RepID=A0A917RE90_9ACTN|nr:TetR family transcriptional regulator [Sphaerisporangium melleum]GII73990.1 TetR family transcriptional regulator [Sphaerisporangium melleum]
MSPEQRREMIVAAALPLVAEQGAAVTTSQIARAAGIGEGTIFRVFADKDELLDACMAEAMNPGHVLRELASISLDDPLDARLVQAAEALRAHTDRIGTVIGALHASGHRRPRGNGDRPAPDGRRASMDATLDAVRELIEPDRAALRPSPETLASVFLGMVSNRYHLVAGESRTPLEEIVDILLHGAFKAPENAAT